MAIKDTKGQKYIHTHKKKSGITNEESLLLDEEQYEENAKMFLNFLAIKCKEKNIFCLSIPGYVMWNFPLNKDDRGVTWAQNT